MHIEGIVYNSEEVFRNLLELLEEAEENKWMCFYLAHGEGLTLLFSDTTKHSGWARFEVIRFGFDEVPEFVVNRVLRLCERGVVNDKLQRAKPLSFSLAESWKRVGVWSP